MDIILILSLCINVALIAFSVRLHRMCERQRISAISRENELAESLAARTKELNASDFDAATLESLKTAVAQQEAQLARVQDAYHNKNVAYQKARRRLERIRDAMEQEA